MTDNACGNCTACCRVFAVPDLKPAGPWCKHCDIGKGCKVYDTRPQVCIDYECLWLQSQHRDDPRERLGPELRPDRCKVVFSPTTNDRIMAAITMPGMSNAWRTGAAAALIRKLVNGGFRVSAGAPVSRTQTLIDKHGEKTVEMTEPDENGMQWRKQE